MSALIEATERKKLIALDDQLQSFRHEIAECTGEIAKALAQSRALRKLREMITPSMVEDMMSLQNTELGFRTDKPDGYPAETIRDVAIEAWLRGFRMVGNEVNIISGRLYGAQAGYKRLVEEWPGLTDLRISLAVPEMRSGGAVVAGSATWKLHGQRDQLLCQKTADDDYRIPVKVNAGMGADAVLGKARRKMYHRIHQQLSGQREPCAEDAVDGIDDPAIDAAGGSDHHGSETLFEKGSEDATER